MRITLKDTLDKINQVKWPNFKNFVSLVIFYGINNFRIVKMILVKGGQNEQSFK